MDLLRVAAFVGAFVGAFIDDAVGAARCNAVLAEAFCNAAARGTARPPDVLNGAARVDLQRLAALDVCKAWARVAAATACMIASEEGCACSATTTDLLQRVVAVYRAKCQVFA